MPLVKSTEYLETYKGALETGRHLLQNVPENADIDFYSKNLISNLQETFTLFEQAEEERAAGNYGEAEYLYNQGLARLEATVESASPEPREDIVAGYNEAFTLCERAQEARAAGNGVEAVNLYHQGFARLRAMERLARPAPAASCSIS